MTVLDADGHVTESYEQLAKYLDEPYRRRPLTFPWYTADGWDRRLVDKFHDWAGNAEQWLRALHEHPEILRAVRSKDISWTGSVSLP